MDVTIADALAKVAHGVQAFLDLFHSLTDAGSASAESIGGIKDALVGVYNYIVNELGGKAGIDIEEEAQ